MNALKLAHIDEPLLEFRFGQKLVYLSLLIDIRDPQIAIADLRKRRDELQTQLHKIYRIAPHTDSSAYGKAQDALKNKEDLTFSDAEIDAFLPDPLKRNRTR